MFPKLDDTIAYDGLALPVSSDEAMPTGEPVSIKGDFVVRMISEAGFYVLPRSGLAPETVATHLITREQLEQAGFSDDQP